MYAVRRNVYQGSDGVQVDCLSEVKGFVEYKEAERIAENCNGRVVRVVKGKKPVGRKVKEKQRWMRNS